MTLLYLLDGIVALGLLVYLGIGLLKMRCILSGAVLALVIVALPVGAFAQQTIFNVTSAAPTLALACGGASQGNFTPSPMGR